MRICPRSASYKRPMRLTSVDFPEPLRPTTPIISPGSIVKLMSCEHRPALVVAERHVLQFHAPLDRRVGGRAVSGRPLSPGASSRSQIRRLTLKKLANQVVDSAIEVKGV